MRIKTNIAAINTSRNQGIVRGNLNKSLEKLSTGYRINRAGDDAAGLAISELMRWQITGLDQAIRNNNDGIGLTNTGEGALQEVQSMLHRMKTLAVQAANESYNTIARGNIDVERQQLLEEIDRISQSTSFAEIPLFESDDSLPADYEPPTVAEYIQLQIGHTKDEILNVDKFYMGSKALELDGTDFTTRQKANESIDVIENAIEAITKVRSSFGASYNHLEHTNNSLGVTKENMTTAESVIRDTDMADEITTFTKENILLQASTSILTHSNSFPQMVLQLIQG